MQTVSEYTKIASTVDVKYPNVGPKSAALIAKEKKFVAHNYLSLPVVLSRGEGVYVWDADGSKYYDYISAYAAVNQGHCHPRIVNTLKSQAGRVTITTRAFHNELLCEHSEFICKYFDQEMFLPTNTGAEAVETAIKIARKYAYEVLGVPDNQAVFISATSCFHGRTLQAVSMSTDPEAREHFGPLVPGHIKVRYNDLEDLEEKLKEYEGRVAGFLVEPIQGEAGIIVPDDGYMRKSYELCKKYKTLFIADEIQTGVGRTGKLLAVDYEQVKPDILVLGKSLTGGVCIASAVLTSEKVMNVMTPGIHGSTFGGNPLSCAVTVEALKVLQDEKMIENSYKKGEVFRQGMRRIQRQYADILTNVRGKGLFNGITLNPTYDKTANDLCLLMKKNGLLSKPTHGNLIRFAPPLVITDEQMDESLYIIDRSFKELVETDTDTIRRLAFA